MSLSSLQLDAFLEVSRTLHFSKAAKNLGITQSALSQRILNLESDLGASLLVREPSGIRLTDLGEELLRYCQAKGELESHFLRRVKSGEKAGLAGVIRVAGFSTVMRSVALPSLRKLLVEHPALQLEMHTAEMRDLPQLLRTGRADFVLLDHEMSRAGVVAQLLGHEENVLIEARNGSKRPDVYLDHDAEDTTTAQFLKLQGQTQKSVQRSFLDEIYGIIDGVELGIGRAVVPRHLVEGNSRVQVVPRMKPLRIPVFLHFYEQPFYSRLHRAVGDAIVRDAKERLGA